MSTLSKAIALAAEKHGEQLDKGGNPYILHPLHPLHPLHIMSELIKQGETGDILIVAVLHDIIEDTNVTTSGLHARGYSPNAVKTIAILTKSETESHEDYIKQISTNEMAKKVKIEDRRYKT